MSKRKRPGKPASIGFGSQKETDSLLDWDNAIFGGRLEELRDIDAQTVTVEAIAINQVHPDPAQPRRAVPSAVRPYWDGTPDTLPQLLTRWLEMVEEERGRPFDLEAYLLGAATERAPDDAEPAYDPAALEAAFLPVVELAASIRRDGLMNPITVVRDTINRYFIETGERRLLAYHLLHTFFDGTHGRPDERKRWSKIPARIMENMSVWRQAAENNARTNLNAIARARQFALLLMDLYGWENFQPIDAFEHEQDFYAQVADGDRFRIPRGQGEKLVAALGLKHTQQLRGLRALLRLPRDVWVRADDENWTENFLRNWEINMQTIAPRIAGDPYADIPEGDDGALESVATATVKGPDGLEDFIETDEHNFPITPREMARIMRDLRRGLNQKGPISWQKIAWARRQTDAIRRWLDWMDEQYSNRAPK